MRFDHRVLLRLGAALAIGALAAPGVALAKSEDTIVLWDGTSKGPGEVLKEGADVVRFRYRGRAEDIKAELIKDIIHGEAPPAYGRADGARKAGRLKRAMDLYENVRDQAGVPEWVKPWATYWIGEAGLTLGTPDALSRAVTELEKVVNDHADHFVIARATYALAEALRQSDRGTDAEAQYEKLESGPWGDRWRHLAKYGKGMSLLARGENNLARTMFAQIRDQSTDPVLISRATFGEGAALINEKRYDDAIAHFARLKEDAASGGADAAPVIAAALVGLAESYLKADPANEQNKKRALIAYIEVTVLYSGAGENYARALHGAAKIYRDLGQTARAEELERELEERCPDSEYARGLGGSDGGSEGGGN